MINISHKCKKIAILLKKSEILSSYVKNQHSYELNKRNIMNNIKKIGLTALAGSLAMTSANAIDYAMTGGMLATFTTQDSPKNAEADSGKGLGVATDLSLNASGELDNGYTVSYFMSVDTNGALSNTSSQMTIGMGSLGTLQYNNIGGSKANGIDDITPNAYNETWDGLSSSNTRNNGSFFGSLTSSGSVDYRIPAQEMGGMTVNASITYDPNPGGAAAKGGVAAANGGSGVAYTLQLAHESGLEIGGGYEEQDKQHNESSAHNGKNATAYIKYAAGGLTFAYQEAYQDTATDGLSKTPDKEFEAMGIAYTSGDFTVSWGESEVSEKATGTTAALATIELESIQAAYVMGAMTVSAAMSSTDNDNGVSGQEYNENTLAVSFAF